MSDHEKSRDLARDLAPDLAMDSLYKEIILEHQKTPRNYGELLASDIQKEGLNPFCGDHIILHLKLNASKDTLEACRFRGKGCAVCLASASMMMEEIEGQKVKNVQQRIEEFRDLMQGRKEPSFFEGDLAALAGVRRFPVRIKCALLSWLTLKEALASKEGSFLVDSQGEPSSLNHQENRVHGNAG